MGKSSSLRPHKARWLPVLKGLGVVLALALIAGFAGLTYVDSTRPGELVFAEESVDVGQLAIGQQVVHRFAMRNAGGKPVTIKKKSASALEGC